MNPKKSSRFLSLVLSAIMVLAMLPAMGGTAEAAGEIVTRNIPLDLTNNEVTYTATDGSTKNASPTITSITDTNEGWSWDFPNKTLTLSGANMDCSGKTYGNSESALSVPDGTKIVLTAGSVNTAKGPNVNASGYGSWGVYGLGQLTISGEGTLNATGGTAITGSYGIEVVNPGKFLYIDGGTINATGLSAATSYGIDGRSEVRGGTGSATGTTRGFFKMPRGTIGSSLINYQDKTVRWPAVPIIFFDTRNGVYIDSAEIANSTITMPTAPTWKDYTFAGWYTGIDGAGTVFANSGLSAKQTVYAKWTKGGKTVRTEALKLTDPASTNPGDQGWTWDYGTLTLDGLLLDHSAGIGEANGEIALPHDATVIVLGTNRVIGGAGGGDGVGVATVATNAYFTIQGSGTLDVVADRIGIAALEGGSLTISGATVNAEARLSKGAGLGAAFTLTIKSGATVSAKGGACAIMGETGGITATDALVTGAKEPFESGTTKMLTQSGTGPVTIGFTPPPVGAHYNVVNGKGSGSRLERSLNKVVTDTN
ncbi:MAG: InlB B-repeat-containing protein, partial [Oscillospiraceae bacterium]